jgi:hypothetical protein
MGNQFHLRSALPGILKANKKTVAPIPGERKGRSGGAGAGLDLLPDFISEYKEDCTTVQVGPHSINLVNDPE